MTHTLGFIRFQKEGIREKGSPGQGALMHRFPSVAPSFSRPFSSSSTGWTPKKGSVAEPGFRSQAPAIGEICSKQKFASDVPVSFQSDSDSCSKALKYYISSCILPTCERLLLRGSVASPGHGPGLRCAELQFRCNHRFLCRVVNLRCSCCQTAYMNDRSPCRSCGAPKSKLEHRLQ